MNPLLKASPDGVLEISERDESYLRLNMSEELLCHFRDRIEDLILLGRSGHAQVHYNITLPDKIDIEGTEVRAPVSSASSRGIGKELGKTIEDLTRNNQSVRVGRLLLPDGQLNAAEVREALDKNQISFGDGVKVNLEDDGALTIPVAPFEYVTEDFILRDPKVLEQIAIHARSSLRPFQEMQPMPKGKLLKPGDFLVGALPISGGPYAMKIDSNLGRGVKHLESGVFLDGGRSTGLSSRLGNERFRQIEITNEGNEAIDVRELKVRLYFYRQFEPDHRVGQIFSLNPQDLERVHDEGIDFFSVLNLQDPATIEALYEDLGGDTYGLVVTPNGHSPIPTMKKTPTRQPLAVSNVIDADSLARSSSENFSELGVYEGLSLTKDQSRMLVFPSISDETELQQYFDKGIRAFVIRGVVEDNCIYHTSALYDKFCELEKKGAVFVFEMPASQNEANNQEPSLRQFYKGFWVKPEARERLDRVETVINMYGWHKAFLAEASRDQIRRFYEGLIQCCGGADKIAVQHGNGPGLMKVADEEARKLGIFTIGVGIQVEQLGQGNANYEPEGVVEFCTADRLPRQKIMDQNGLFSFINLGGDGTNEEDGIDGCTTKLGEKVTTPRIRIDPTISRTMRNGEEQTDHFYAPAKAMADRRSNTVEVNIAGEKVDISQTPLTQTHMAEIFHLEKSYDGALAIVQEFINDPIAYWKKIGMSEAQIKLSLFNAQKLWQKFDRKTPAFLEEAINHYLRDDKS